MTVQVGLAAPAHLDVWAAMRVSLWPDDTVARHSADAAAMLGREDVAAFIASMNGGEIVGFVEAAIRRDHVNGCDTSPVAFVEGLYVVPDHRRTGVGAALVARVVAWERSRGCHELASDAPIGNRDSHRFHHAVGFAETERVVFFRRSL